MHQKLWLVLFCRRYLIFICKYWHYNLCQSYFEEDKNYLYSYLFAPFQKFPQDIVPKVPISVITSILLKLHGLSTIREQLRIGSQSRKCQEMIQWKASTEVVSIRRRNDIEKSTWRTHRYFFHFESRIHVEISMSNRCHNFHVVRLLKSM